MNKSRPLNFIKKHKVWSVVLAIVLLVLILAYGLPLSVGSGTEKFNGKEKDIAKGVLEATANSLRTRERALDYLGGQFQYYVEDVRVMTSLEVAKCKLPSSDDGTGYYMVYISRVTVFGMRVDKAENFYASCYVSREIKNKP